MSQAVSALEFLLEDVDNVKKIFEEGEPFRSLLQRNDKDFGELLELFDYEPDDSDWIAERTPPDRRNKIKLKRFRNRVAFLAASKKEWHEDYGDDVSDVDFIRLLQVGHDDRTKYPLNMAKYEMEDH